MDISLFRRGWLVNPAYTLVWNNMAAQMTFYQISDEMRSTVMARYLIAENHDGGRYQMYGETSIVLGGGYYMAMSLAENGIPPILPRKSKKWFFILDPKPGLFILKDRVEEMILRAHQDFRVNHGIDFEGFLKESETFWQEWKP